MVFLLAACSGNSTPPASVATSSPPATVSPPTPTSRTVPFASVRIGLRRIATLDQPISIAVRAGDPALYVAEKTGRVVAIRGGHVVATPVLDLSGRVSQGGEQGLLGIAFSPDGRYLYADFTDAAGNTHVTQWAFPGGRADARSERTILYVRQPYANHNGGQIAFGPDGDLYVGLGDGGSEGDPQGNGQNLATLLGKILRIRPTTSGPHPYTIPPDNPFVGRAGARPEIWAYGLRNPYTFAFQPGTGRLHINDVGQNTWEEIDVGAAGANYGWPGSEGPDNVTAGITAPLFTYKHSAANPPGSGAGGFFTGFAIAGGAFYPASGPFPASYRDQYYFADYVSQFVGRLDLANGAAYAFASLSNPSVDMLVGSDGALYVLTRNGVTRISAP